MNVLWSIILGAVQGLTEFLPVSSSGHLVIVQQLVPGFDQPGVLYDTVLHAGTLTSVIYVFRKKVFKLSKKYLLLLVVGTVPVAVIGYFAKSAVESLFENLSIVGLALIITGVLNLITNRFSFQNKSVKTLDSLKIGIAQAFALIPGISRSGATIFAGTKLGIDETKAVEFSFILSIPAIIGANALQLVSLGPESNLPIFQYIVGFLSSMVFGIYAIRLVFKLLKERKFSFFGYYCLLLGLVVLLTRIF